MVVIIIMTIYISIQTNICIIQFSGLTKLTILVFSMYFSVEHFILIIARFNGTFIICVV